MCAHGACIALPSLCLQVLLPLQVMSLLHEGSGGLTSSPLYLLCLSHDDTKVRTDQERSFGFPGIRLVVNDPMTAASLMSLELRAPSA